MIFHFYFYITLLSFISKDLSVIYQTCDVILCTPHQTKLVWAKRSSVELIGCFEKTNFNMILTLFIFKRSTIVL